jgi:ATP-binding cassette subfamily D (ALD) long-chain fatty acid import protein
MAEQSTLKKYSGYAVFGLWIAKNIIQNSELKKYFVKKQEKRPDSAVAPKKKRDDYKTFNKDMRYLLGVCFPTWTCSESLLAVAFVLVLLARTVLSLFISDLDGYLVKQMINRDKTKMITGIIRWFAIAIPSSYTNAIIAYLRSRLALSIRKRLTDHVRDLYFKDETYFRVSHLDKRVPHPETAMTEDVKEWADRIADLFASLGKPMVDLTFFSAVLFSNLGFVNQSAASIVVWETGQILRYFRPNFAEIVQRRGNLEADLRLSHTRVIASSEEIAFCSGGDREKNILVRGFNNVAEFTLKTLKQNIAYQTGEDFVTKYLWGAVGLAQVSLPLMQAAKAGEKSLSRASAGDKAKWLITIRRTMVRNGDATERLLLGVKDMQEFRGFTRKLMGVINVFKDTKHGRAQTGTIVESDDVIVDQLPIVTPLGDVLIEKMNLKLFAGDRLLILGPNGCGKSSLFRILCGLWPMTGGAIAKPAKRTDLFFLPQRPYMVPGTFRDQVIYPQTTDEMRANGKTDEDIMKCLSDAMMTPVLESHGGLDTTKQWTEVLSGGEKQRLGIARVMYHSPKFAILDECSSAINVEAEQFIFGKLLLLGIGLITISHRHSLFKFHEKVLTFDGEGHYDFNEKLHCNELEGLSSKKQTLMKDLSGVLRQLGEDWPQHDQN